MFTYEKKLEVLHCHIKKERAMSKIGGELGEEHKEYAQVLAEIYSDIAKLGK